MKSRSRESLEFPQFLPLKSYGFKTRSTFLADGGTGGLALLHALLVLAICRQVAFDAAPVGTTEFISS